MAYSKQTWADSPATSSPISAARLGNIESGIVSVDRGTFASRPGSGVNSGDLYYCTDIGNVYRWNGSSWDVARGGNLEVFTPPPSASWTALNSGSVSAALDSRVVTANSGTSDAWKGEYRTLSPTSNYTATVYLNASVIPTNFSNSGMLLRNSSSGNMVVFGMAYDSGWWLRTGNWTSATSWSANVTSIVPMKPVPRWLRVRDNATNRIWEYSYNGVDWIQHSSVTRTSYITPDQVGWAVNQSSNIARLRHFAIT